MILVILAISIAMVVLGLYIQVKSRPASIGRDTGKMITKIFSWIVIAVSTATIILTISVSNNSTIVERITLYEEENQKIEQQIDILVKDYQEYERGVFADTTVDSAITLVSLYPELKADQLVSSQLDIYVKNNEQIKYLKLEQINADVVRWWLYFGGK